MISYNKETKQLEINDNYKGRLQSSRIMSSLIFIMAVLKLYLANWNQPREMDYVFCIIAAVFAYLCFKSFFKNTAIDKIDKTSIKFVKMPRLMATKATIKLTNGKSRDVFGLKTQASKDSFKKVLSDAKIQVI